MGRQPTLQQERIYQGVKKQYFHGKGPKKNLQELIMFIENIINNTNKLLDNMIKLSQGKGKVTLESLRKERDSLFSRIDTVRDFISEGKYRKNYPYKAIGLFRILDFNMSVFYEENWFGKPYAREYIRSTHSNDGFINTAYIKKLTVSDIKAIRLWLDSLRPKFIVPFEVILKFNIPVGGMDAKYHTKAGVDDSLKWLAAESKYLNELREDMKKVEDSTRIKDESKAARKARKAFIYLSRCDRKADHALYNVVDALKHAVRDHPELLKLEEGVEIGEKKLIKAFSLYHGDTRNKLHRLDEEIAARQTKPSPDRDQAIDQEIHELAKEIEGHLDQLLQWLNGLVVLLKEVDKIEQKYVVH